MSNFAARFKGLASASVSSRLPDPKEGEGWFLVDTAEMKDNRGGGYRVAITLTCLKGLTEGGNTKGDRVGKAIFSGDYFLKEFKQFLFAAAGVDPSDEDDLIEHVCSGMEVSGLDDLQKKEVAWEQLAALACGLDGDGNKTQPGCFDGQTVLYLASKLKEAKPTGKYTMVDGKPVPEMTKPFLNTYFQRNVPLSEVAAELDEKDIARFFGSVEKFTEMLAEAE